MKRGFVILRKEVQTSFNFPERYRAVRAAQAVCLAWRVDECVDGNC